ncbi:Coumaroyl-CoA\\x3aanthocyanidin 3-O-glucoside-6-O-coumaroyltransferase 2 [Striga hermonthica]|uniref:Coumaroyl-CoA\x3aanthocyanidin 3-O-glucoside-6-O-coumaroyltransferase 2 n=1 Tax=Striga hermonthica TaxID=68872 RepID=A0A9N7N5E9_STRHE|nr:Coumaroyl-CoA\\x3aanthocyanidin 3-O-glucoside-6-O-coumaroyltransferase 2 [Striga hermonthica]
MSAEKLTVLSRSAVAPPDGSAGEHVLPLTYFDVVWIHYHPIQRLIFYPYPCSTDIFLQKIAPNLKISLSKTLAHHLPLAGNLIIPRSSDRLELRYSQGDSVQVTFAESNGDLDFGHLTGNNPRDSNQFHVLVPDLPNPKSELGFDEVPVLAVQVTLFPETGIAIGITNHHAAGDASSIVGFIKAWSSLAKLSDGENVKVGENGNLPSPPLYDRSLIKDPSGRADLYLNQMRALKIGPLPLTSASNKVRATFVLQKNEIEAFRNLLSARYPALAHLSSFTVTAAYVWACLTQADVPVNDDEPEYFGFAVDTRSRLEPPLPASYFGNCLAFAFVEIKHGELRSENGFLTAGKMIGELIANKVNKKEELLRDADEWLVKCWPLLGKRAFSVSGSPRFDLYDGADFGLGKPVKYEAVSIDGDRSMSLCKSRDFEGGLEIGLSFAREIIDAFGSIFYHRLEMR